MFLGCHSSPGELELAVVSYDHRATDLTRWELAMASMLLAGASWAAQQCVV